MYRGTTPKLKVNVVSEIDLSKMEKIWVTVSSKINQVTIEEEDLLIVPDENVFYFDLTQEQTLSFNAGEVELQVRMLDENKNAFASSIVPLDMNRILKDGVIE